MSMRKIVLMVTILLFAGCTSVQVTPAPSGTQLKLVCIQKNPKVIRADFLPTVEAGFHRHGINTSVYDGGQLPAGCDAKLRYTARQSWDFTPILSYAELWLTDRRGRQIGHGLYEHHAATFSWAVTKWFSTEKKMKPVIDQLLAGVSGARGPGRAAASKTTQRPAYTTESHTGTFSYGAQQIAYSQRCSMDVELVKQDAVSELYNSPCANGQQLVILCEMGNCRLLR